MKVILKENYLIDLSQVQFARLICRFNGIIPNYLIRLVFINGKEEEIAYKDEEKAINDFKQFAKLSVKGDKND